MVYVPNELRHHNRIKRRNKVLLYYVIFLLNSRSSTVEKDRCIVDVDIGAERNM